MILSSLPPFEGLHPIIVHFPIALIIFAPVLLILGVILRQNLKSWVLIAGITLSCGTLGAFAALETGEATAEYVDRTEQLETLIEAHAEVASQMLYTFTALSVVFWICYLGSRVFLTKLPRPIRIVTLGGYGIAYLVGLILLLQTAHLGGALVHVHGIHAPMANIPNADSTTPD